MIGEEKTKMILDGHTLVAADLMTWARWFENGENRRVAEDKIEGVYVSTVFLGLDHGFGGPPLWFETMVFGGELDQEQDRYATWDEAEAGHAKMVERVRSALKAEAQHVSVSPEHRTTEGE